MINTATITLATIASHTADLVETADYAGALAVLGLVLTEPDAPAAARRTAVTWRKAIMALPDRAAAALPADAEWQAEAAARAAFIEAAK